MCPSTLPPPSRPAPVRVPDRPREPLGALGRGCLDPVRDASEAPSCGRRNRRRRRLAVDSHMGNERWVRRAALVDYGLGLLVIGAGMLAALVLVAGAIGLAVLILVARS